MKKLKFPVLILILLVAALCTGCNWKKLPVPTGVELDIENVLSWDEVPETKSYMIEIKNVDTDAIKENSTRKPSYSLAKLEEGDYEIRIKCVGDGKEHKDSDYTKVLNFHKAYETGCLYTSIRNDTAFELTKVGSASNTVYIEDEYRGKPVVTIANNAFKGSGRVVEIYVGNNVETLGDSVFYNCPKLAKVVIPDNVTSVGRALFQSCRALTEVILPKTLNKIDDFTFSYCRALTNITIGENVKTIGESAFADCTSLKSIVIPDNVISIADFAFLGDTALESVTFGSGLQTIGTYVFDRCSSLTEVNFSENSSLQTVGECCFSECTSLIEIDLPEGSVDYGKQCFYGDEKLERITIPDSVKHVGAYSFTGTKLVNDHKTDDFIYADKWLVACGDGVLANITEITIDTLKPGIIGIADEVFAVAPKLGQVFLPQSVKIIGDYSFASCPELWKIETYDNSLEEIGKYAFYGCKVLKRLLFGEGLKSIGEMAFYGCTLIDNSALEGGSIIPSSVTSVGLYAFQGTALWNKPDAYGVIYAGDWVVGCTGMYSLVNLKSTTKGIADYAFYKCEYIKSVVGLSYASYIGRGAFSDCTRLETVTLNRVLKEISPYAFYKCSSLKTVNFPSRLTKIGRSAFYDCQSLVEVDLSGTMVEFIDEYAFYRCFANQKFDMSDSLETISAYAFTNNTSLAEVVFSDSVKTIGDYAFYKNLSLNNMTLGSGVETIGDYAFTYNQSLKHINIPAATRRIGQYAFYNCSEVTDLTFEEGVEYIDNYAFFGVNKITSVTLPTSLKHIGNYCFKGWENVPSFIIKSDAEYIGAHAFYGAKTATIYTDATTYKPEWHTRLNSSFRPMIWGCTLSEDKSYVVSVTMTETTITNNKYTFGTFSAPVREGYVCVGWTTKEGSSEVEYTIENFDQIPIGTTVYAVWQVPVEDSEE